MGRIETSAFLHQHRREKVSGAIVATLEDYQIARKLFQHCYEVGADRSLEKLLSVAEKLAAREGSFTAADIIAGTGWGKSKAYELLKRAEELGCVVEAGERSKYRFVRSSTVPPLNLPDEL